MEHTCLLILTSIPKWFGELEYVDEAAAICCIKNTKCGQTRSKSSPLRSTHSLPWGFLLKILIHFFPSPDRLSQSAAKHMSFVSCGFRGFSFLTDFTSHIFPKQQGTECNGLRLLLLCIHALKFACQKMSKNVSKVHPIIGDYGGSIHFPTLCDVSRSEFSWKYFESEKGTRIMGSATGLYSSPPSLRKFGAV